MQILRRNQLAPLFRRALCISFFELVTAALEAGKDGEGRFSHGFCV